MKLGPTLSSLERISKVASYCRLLTTRKNYQCTRLSDCFIKFRINHRCSEILHSCSFLFAYCLLDVLLDAEKAIRRRTLDQVMTSYTATTISQACTLSDPYNWFLVLFIRCILGNFTKRRSPAKRNISIPFLDVFSPGIQRHIHVTVHNARVARIMDVVDKFNFHGSSIC